MIIQGRAGFVGRHLWLENVTKINNSQKKEEKIAKSQTRISKSTFEFCLAWWRYNK